MRFTSISLRQRPLRLFTLALTLLTLLAAAVDEFELDLTYLGELSRMGFNDYVELQLGKMQKLYPDQSDVINLEKARAFYASGRSTEAEKALAAIPASAKIANDVLLFKAQVSAARRQWADADKVYKQFFSKNPQPVSNRRNDQETFKTAVLTYNNVLKALNKPQEAAKILDLLSQVKGAIDERQMAFLKLQTLIDNEDNKAQSGGDVTAKALQDAITGLNDLLFVRDGVSATASLQLARASILIGRQKLATLMPAEAAKKGEIAKITDFEQAIKTINTVSAFIEELEKSLGNAGSSRSLLVDAQFYKAIAFASHAIVTYNRGDQAKAKAQVRGAATLLERLQEEYPDNPFQARIILEFAACNKFSEARFNEKIEMKGGGTGALIAGNLDKVRAFLSQKKYKEAYPPALEALRLGRAGKRLPEIGSLLIVCLAEMDDVNGALALLDYLGDAAPTAPETADAALRLGAMFYTKSRSETSAARKDELDAMTMLAWDRFVTAAPDHPKAPDVAFTVAEQAYKQAAALAQAANAATNPADKAKKAEAAREAFRRTVPKYQRLVEVFGAFSQGTRALYKLGWCHDSLDEKNEAAEAFLDYYEKEDNRKYADDRLEAKFRAAYLMMYGDLPHEAAPLFRELQDVLARADSGFDRKGQTASRILEDCSAYLPWAIDFSAEKFRPAINAFRLRQKGLQDRLDSLRKMLRAGQESLAAMAQESQALDLEHAEVITAIDGMLADLTALATGQISTAMGENTAAMSAAELAKHKEGLAEGIRKRVADLETQKRNEVAGQLLTLEKRRADAIARREQAEKALAAITAEGKTVKAKVAELTRDLAAIQTELDDFEKAREAAEREHIQADADKRTAEGRKASAQAALDEAEDKTAAQQELDAASKETDEITARFQEAFTKLKSLTDEAKLQEIAQRREDLLKVEEEQQLALDDAIKYETDLKLAGKEAESAAADQLAAARQLALCELYGQIMAKPLADRQNSADDLNKNREAAREAETALNNLRQQKITIRRDFLAYREKYARDNSAAAEKQLQTLQEQHEPARGEFTTLKQQAVTAFNTFLNDYPQSTKKPENLARLGSIYLFDLNENQKAAEILQKLATDHPDSAPAKNAFFMLGRAQAENGNPAEAAKSFEKLLAQPESVPLANLIYIADIGLKADAPQVTLLANREILARAANPKHPDHKSITRGYQDRALFTSGQAAFIMKKFDDCIRSLEKLLENNPRTGYFFDVKFLLAESRLQQRPPDLAALEKDVGDILMFAENPLQRTRASCLYADALAQGGDSSRRQAALTNYQLVLLADPAVPENREYIERALYGSAKLFAEGQETQQARAMVSRYRELFSGGKHLAELNRLVP